jgi:hypothetical protein
MTVNTNGTKVQDMYAEPSTPYVTDEASILHDIRNEVAEIRDSQLRTEEMVKGFVESMGKNPMFATMAKMFGGK